MAVGHLGRGILGRGRQVAKTSLGARAKLSRMSTEAVEIEEAHRKACEAGERLYKDPKTGYHVFTEFGHRERGFCCGNGCRHCPFNHENVGVPKEKRKKKEDRKLGGSSPAPLGFQDTRLLKHSKKELQEGERQLVLFWSGGKDRALQARVRAGDAAKILLLTTFSQETRIVAFQNTKIEAVVAQAEHEELDLLAIPLVGDLHLEDIRDWRVNTFGDHFPCQFPVFKRPYEELMAALWEEQAAGRVEVLLTAVREDLKDICSELRVGRIFDSSFVDALRGLEGHSPIDLMGENGEFHSHVYFLPVEPAAVVT